MQMDACFRKEQIGTLFVCVGALEGGFRGGRPSGVSTPKSIRVVPKINSCSGTGFSIVSVQISLALQAITARIRSLSLTEYSKKHSKCSNKIQKRKKQWVTALRNNRRWTTESLPLSHTHF
jgi:hypothetical protein